MKNESVVALQLMRIFKICIILLVIGAMWWFLHYFDNASDRKTLPLSKDDTPDRKNLPLSKKERLRIALNDFNTLEEYLENDPSAAEFVDSPDGRSALLSAARNGNTDIVAKILKLGADPDMRSDDGGKTPLHLAAEYGHLEVAELLWQHGAKTTDTPDDDGNTPLHLVACSQAGVDVEMVKALLERGADPRVHGFVGWTPLHCIAKQDNTESANAVEAARLLLEHGADVNAGNGPLGYAVLLGRVVMVRFLLDHGADVNQDHALSTAVNLYPSKTEMIRLLVDAGADVNERYGDETILNSISGSFINCYFKNKKNNPGFRSALHKSVSILLDAGADPNPKLTYRPGSPLGAAVEYGCDLELIRILLEAGAKVDAPQRTSSQIKPLGLALGASSRASLGLINSRTSKVAQISKDNILEVAKLLLAHGADPNTKKGDGESLLAYAVSHGLTDMAAILLESGAEINGKIVEMALDKPEMQELLRKHARDFP